MENSLLDLFDLAAECTAEPKSARKVGALTIVCHPNGGSRIRVPKPMMAYLQDVKAVGVKMADDHMFIFAKDGGHELRPEKGGAAVIYSGELVQELAEKYSWDFGTTHSLHFDEWEALDGKQAVAIKVA